MDYMPRQAHLMTAHGIWIVTVKFKLHKYHNPSKKKLNHCQTSDFCSDSTGAHHCFLVRASTLIELMTIVRNKYPNIHVTRYEYAQFIEELPEDLN